MRIIEHHSLAMAASVLENLKKVVRGGRLPGKFYLNHWSNGREQGYHLCDLKKAVCFGENRNSDEVVVYHGAVSDFDITTNQPKNWKDAKYFSNPVEAAKFIADFFERE